jgi:hypothetical protein
MSTRNVTQDPGPTGARALDRFDPGWYEGLSAESGDWPEY